MAVGRWARKIGVGAAFLVVGAAVFLFATEPGKAIRDIWRSGAVQDVMTPVEQRKYEASRTDNLKAIYTALKLFQTSEGQYPAAAKWMDDIENRISSNDLSPEEAKKKLIRPDLAGKPAQFGYAINDAAAGKYLGDLKAGTVLIYETKQTARNAHGDPKADGGKTFDKPQGITIEGKVVPL